MAGALARWSHRCVPHHNRLFTPLPDLTDSQLYQEIVFDELIPDIQKNRIVLVFSEIDKRLVDGADEHLSILDLALRISGIMAGRN